MTLGAGDALAGAGGGDASGTVALGAGCALAGAGGGDAARGAVALGAGGVLAGAGGDDAATQARGAVALGAGGALAGAGGGDAALGGDPLRGGAGGSSTTRRKRTERLLQGLHGLLEDWGNEEGQDTGADDEAEVLFQQLEQLLWARPADPFRALQRLLQQWTGKHDVSSSEAWASPSAPRWRHKRAAQADADYAPSSSWQGGGSSGADAAWWGEDSSTTRWHAVPPASSGRPPAPAADDCGWQTVSRRKPKGRKQGDSAPARVVQLGQGSATAKGSGKGSGKGRDTVKTGNAGTEGTMRAADWCPCASDWDTGAVIVHTIDEVWADPTLDYVVFPRNAGELERFRTFVQSSESAPDITFIVFKGDAELEAGRKEFSEVEWTEARVPGTWRHQLRVASVWLAQCSPEAPALKTTGLQPKAPVVQSTSVLRVHSDWVYCEKGEKAWAEITKNPGSHFRAWAAASFGSIKDTWQWQLTRGPGGAEATVEGLIRMPSARVAAAMSASGSRHGGETWFVSNVSRAQELQGVPALSVHWQDWEPNEAWGTYLARCRRAAQAVDFGLARGAKQLGVRRVASEAELARPRTLRRLWRACGIPRAWR